MLQDNGMEILRHAAKYLHQRWLHEGREDDGDYAAVNILKWIFTGEASFYEDTCD